MAIYDDCQFRDNNNNFYHIDLTDRFCCTPDETYKEGLAYRFDGVTVPDYWDQHYNVLFMVDISLHPNYNGRCALYIKSHNSAEFIASVNNTVSFNTETWIQRTEQHVYTDYASYLGTSPAASEVSDYTIPLMCSTNVPIFRTEEDAVDYLTAPTQLQALVALKKAVNYESNEKEPETFHFNITNFGVTQTWTKEGKSSQLDDAIYHNTWGEMISSESDSIALYPIEGVVDGSLKYGVKINPNAEFYIVWYSTDGKEYIIELDGEFPFDFFWRKRTNELGTFRAALTDIVDDSTNTFLVFKDENDAQGFIDGTVKPSDAINWNIVNNYYPNYNYTGEEENATEFGEIWLRSQFSQIYLCTNTTLSEIANNLFDTSVGTGVWDAIKRGVEMYGQNPMDAVQGLTFYPFDLSSVFHLIEPKQSVWFGGYQLQLQQSSCYKVISPQGYIDIGTFEVKRTYNDWRDFEPYTKLSVFLPYIGVEHLDLARYYGKTISVRYYVDIRTAVCMAVLTCNGLMYDYFMGQMGIQMPITLTDFATYASNQINTILQGASSALSVSNGFCGSIANIGMQAASRVYAGENRQVATSRRQHRKIDPFARDHDLSRTMVGMTAGSELGVMGYTGALTAMKTTFELVNNGIGSYNKTKGTATSLLNGNLPQYVTFMFERMESQESPYLRELAGKPSNASGTIESFSGYLECDDVMLICPIATDAERQEIIDLVCAGIYL